MPASVRAMMRNNMETATLGVPWDGAPRVHAELRLFLNLNPAAAGFLLHVVFAAGPAREL
jgi:hypothetical protein